MPFRSLDGIQLPSEIVEIVLILQLPTNQQSLDKLLPVAVDPLLVLVAFSFLFLLLLLVPGVDHQVLELLANYEPVVHWMAASAVEIEPGHGLSAIDAQLLANSVQTGH